MGNGTPSITVTAPSGDRVRLELESGHTAQDVIAALIQGGKLEAEDSQGNPMRYELVDDSTLSLLPGDRPLVDLGIGDGAELRVKPGAHVGEGPIN